MNRDGTATSGDTTVIVRLFSKYRFLSLDDLLFYDTHALRVSPEPFSMFMII